jgi:hypothetical protein
MGIDCRFWMFPQQRAFRPNAEQFACLANSLRDGNWVPKPDAPGQKSRIFELLPVDSPSPMAKKPTRVQAMDSQPFAAGWVEFHSQYELVVEWHVQNLREAVVQYPFEFDPYPDSGPPYFYVRLILGQEFFYWTGENVMPFEDASTKCLCGEQLAYWTGWAHGAPSERIHRACPRCGKEFDPSGKVCKILDGWTGAASPLIGGLTFRFAMVVDCHKYWPHDREASKRFHLRADFLDLWRKCVGVPFQLVVTFD